MTDNYFDIYPEPKLKKKKIKEITYKDVFDIKTTKTKLKKKLKKKTKKEIN